MTESTSVQELEECALVLHQLYRGPKVPLVSLTPLGSRTPDHHCVTRGALGCLFRISSETEPLMLTCKKLLQSKVNELLQSKVNELFAAKGKCPFALTLSKERKQDYCRLSLHGFREQRIPLKGAVVTFCTIDGPRAVLPGWSFSTSLIKSYPSATPLNHTCPLIHTSCHSPPL